MPISELCSSFYLLKPLEECVVLDPRGGGLRGWLDTPPLHHRAKTTAVTRFATRESVALFLHLADGSHSYTPVGSMAQPL